MQKLDWNFYSLLTCYFLFVFTETMFSPYYPQFFAAAFKNQDISVSGEYIALCRLTVMLCLPVWGYVARIISPLRILIVTQIITACFTALCALTVNVSQFFICSILLLISKSSYVLFFTQLINLRPDKKAHTIALTQACFHIAIICSTLMSSWVLSLSQPLHFFYVLAVLDVLQILLCLKLFTETRKMTYDNRSSNFKWLEMRSIILLAIVFLLYFSINVIRPYYTTFLAEVVNIPNASLSVIYLVPSLIALIFIPLIKYYKNPKFLSTVFGMSLLMLAASFFLQNYSYNIWTIFLSRTLFGISSIFCIAALDYFILNKKERDTTTYYTIAVAIQNAALLFAPFIASQLVSQGNLTWPFYVAAGCILPVLLLAYVGIVRPLLNLSFRKSGATL